jgi:hypothetical protein
MNRFHVTSANEVNMEPNNKNEFPLNVSSLNEHKIAGQVSQVMADERRGSSFNQLTRYYI